MQLSNKHLNRILFYCDIHLYIYMIIRLNEKVVKRREISLRAPIKCHMKTFYR